MPESNYQCLAFARPRSGFRGFTLRTALWLGGDHLLCVDTTGYTEKYKRFYFRDIQAFTMHRSARRTSLNIFLGIIGAIFGLVALSLFGEHETTAAAIVLGCSGGAVLSLLLINTLMGPTIICHLRTAVQTEELAPLKRLRQARKVFDRLRPLIEAAQGRMSPEEMQSLYNQLTASGGATPSSPQSAPGGPIAAALPGQPGAQ